MLHVSKSGTAALAVMALTLAACSGQPKESGGMAADTSGMMASEDSMSQAAPTTLTDAQIADICLTANSIDSTAGKYALDESKTKAIRDFAQTMVHDHSAVNEKVVTLAQKLGVTPEDNDVSKQLKEGAEQAHGSLEDLDGAAFDKAYIEREVAYHQAVLDALDNTLIPGAQNAELKALLVAVRPNFEAHLKRAKAVRDGLGG